MDVAKVIPLIAPSPDSLEGICRMQVAEVWGSLTFSIRNKIGLSSLEGFKMSVLNRILPRSVSARAPASSKGYAPHEDVMLRYFLSMLDVRAQWLESNVQLDQKQTDILKNICERRAELLQKEQGTISEDSAWTEAYCLERLMVLLEPAESILMKIRTRLDEAASERVLAEPRLRAALIVAEERALDKTKTPPALIQEEVPNLRALLLDVLEEKHWTLQRKFHGRPAYKSAVRRIVVAGLISFTLFMLPFFLVYFRAYSFNEKGLGASPLYAYTALPLYMALTAGLFGAYFSRLWYIQQAAGHFSLGELKTAREVMSILLRGCVGMCGGLIVFFFLRSGLVSGELFPDFSELGLWEEGFSLRNNPESENVETLRLILPSPSLALLTIWCFLAGFSERLVPSILSSTEKALDNATRKGGKSSP